MSAVVEANESDNQREGESRESYKSVDFKDITIQSDYFEHSNDQQPQK